MAVDETHFDGLNGLVRLSGANVPARAQYVAETLITASLSSLTFGLVFGQLGATIYTVGPILPFLIGSWTGYTFGLITHAW